MQNFLVKVKKDVTFRVNAVIMVRPSVETPRKVQTTGMGPTVDGKSLRERALLSFRRSRTFYFLRVGRLVSHEGSLY